MVLGDLQEFPEFWTGINIVYAKRWHKKKYKVSAEAFPGAAAM
jgi:hypothetical protein